MDLVNADAEAVMVLLALIVAPKSGWPSIGEGWQCQFLQTSCYDVIGWKTPARFLSFK